MTTFDSAPYILLVTHRPLHLHVVKLLRRFFQKVLSAGILFTAIKVSTSTKYVGEGKRRHEFAEWHVAWLAQWYNYAECNILRMTQRNKLKWKVRRFLAPINLLTPPLSQCCGPNIRWQSKSHEGSLSVSLFRTATKIRLACMATPILHRESWPLKKRYFRKSCSLLL